MAALKYKKLTKVTDSAGKLNFPQKIQEAVGEWYKFTEPMREARTKMLAHYAAGWYSDINKSYAQPINLIDRGVQILAPYLISTNPKVNIESKRDIALRRPFARTLELAIEHLLKEIKFADYTLRPCVVNSFFSMGITKTGVYKDSEIEIFGYLHDVGQIYCDNVDFNNYIGDVPARNRQEMQIEGDIYRLPEEWVKTSGLYKKTDNLKTDMQQYGEQTDPDRISRNENHQNYSELRATVELIDIWLPDEKLIITIPPEGQGDHILRTVEWDGPEGGPYDTLGYRYFPDSTIPIPPVFMWMDMNKVINELVVKMKKQALRSKNIVLYERGASTDMQTLLDTSDGDTAGVQSVDSIKEITYGQVNDQLYPFIQYLEHQYSITGGNLYTMGGRETQAETLGQEQMLQANASKQLEDMVKQLQTFTKSLVEKITHFLWVDPLVTVPVIKQAGGVSIEVEYSAEAQEGDFFDYAFDIEPYSMSHMSPEMRYQRLMQLISQVVLPTAQIAAAQGTSLNVSELVKEAARYLDVRNIDRWWESAVPTETQANPYQPLQGTPKSGQQDGRFGQEKGANGSNFNNLNAQQTRQQGQAGQTTKGM